MILNLEKEKNVVGFKIEQLIAAVVMGMCMTVSLGGCASNTNSPSPPLVPPEFFTPYSYQKHDTHIEFGDILNVSFFYHPELNVKQRVRSDGKISLTFNQGLYVAGDTPEELQKKLTSLYSATFINPVITVDIEKADSYVLVTGEVKAGGTKQLKGNTTIAQILSDSSVYFRKACLESVVLVRRHTHEQYKVYTINVDFITGPERDVYLAPGDIIFVPRNRITKINDFVQQYIRNVIPPNMNLGLGYTYELHNDEN